MLHLGSCVALLGIQALVLPTCIADVKESHGITHHGKRIPLEWLWNGCSIDIRHDQPQGEG